MSWAASRKFRPHLLAWFLAWLFCAAADSSPRSPAIRAEFRKSNPCPSTGRLTGACPGWQIDHMHPLCAGGIDHPDNLNWIRVEDHKRKTRQDVKECRAAKASGRAAPN